MKFEVTYFDSLKNKEQTIRLTGINEAKVKENFISSYDQKRYPFKSIRGYLNVYRYFRSSFGLFISILSYI